MYSKNNTSSFYMNFLPIIKGLRGFKGLKSIFTETKYDYINKIFTSFFLNAVWIIQTKAAGSSIDLKPNSFKILNLLIYHYTNAHAWPEPRKQFEFNKNIKLIYEVMDDVIKQALFSKKKLRIIYLRWKRISGHSLSNR